MFDLMETLLTFSTTIMYILNSNYRLIGLLSLSPLQKLIFCFATLFPEVQLCSLAT